MRFISTSSMTESEKLYKRQLSIEQSDLCLKSFIVGFFNILIYRISYKNTLIPKE